jgi:hypothetical protein
MQFALTQEVLKIMFLTKLKLGTAAVLCACLIVVLIGGSFTSLGIAQDAKPKPAKHDFTNLQRLATALENYNYPEDTADKITVWCQGGGKGNSVLVKDAKTLDVATACHYIVDGHHDKEGLDLENVAVVSADGTTIRFVNIKKKFAAKKPFGSNVNRGDLVIVLQLRKD